MALIERLEAATEGSRALDDAVAHATGNAHQVEVGDAPDILYTPEYPGGGMRCNPPRFTTSIEMALTLMPVGWQAILYTETFVAELYDSASNPRRGIQHRVGSGTLPLALCIAALKARAA